MNKLDTLKAKVATLYQTETPGRADFADWMYDQHVLHVAAQSREVAKTHGADPELAEVAGLLHDIADIKMKRSDDDHAEESLRIARQVMGECGYSEEQIKVVVDDAIRLHSCYDHVRPVTPEGQALATGDALAHLKTDFYLFAALNFARGMSLEEFKQWVLSKVERDFNDKICFDDVREATRADYEVIKNLFSRAPYKSSV